MLSTDAYPYLSHLLSSYFHQDAFDDEGETSESILREFKQVAHAYEVAGLSADIERFLHQAPERALDYFERTFNPDLILAQSDDELRVWLRAALAILRAPATD